MTEEQRNELLGLIVGQCDCLRDDPNEANRKCRDSRSRTVARNRGHALSDRIETTPMIVVGSTPQIVDFSKLLLNPLNLCCTSRKSLDEHLICESYPTSSIPNDCDRNGTAVGGFFHFLTKDPR
jgi:hypothetical protein